GADGERLLLAALHIGGERLLVLVARLRPAPLELRPRPLEAHAVERALGVVEHGVQPVDLVLGQRIGGAAPLGFGNPAVICALELLEGRHELGEHARNVAGSTAGRRLDLEAIGGVSHWISSFRCAEAKWPPRASPGPTAPAGPRAPAAPCPERSGRRPSSGR